MGLSPRVRGNPSASDPRHSILRSIPACAGEPEHLADAISPEGVYPRVCGGTLPVRSSLSSRPGLSPRVRGNRPSHDSAMTMRRSIPACAGEPASSLPTSSPPAVYPRVCGGTLAYRPGASAIGGLSPRVRGNRSLKQADLGRIRSIPAWAGEPWPVEDVTCWRRVYPRVGGGTKTISRIVKTSKGLSPRGRGNHGYLSYDAVDVRSIPACAGEPCWWRSWWKTPRVYPRVCGGTSIQGI